MITTIVLSIALQSAFDTGRTLPIAAGDWTYTADAAGSTARFGNQFLIRCDRNTRRVTLNRLLPGPPALASQMTVITDTRSFSYPGTVAALGVLDPALDAIAFTRGRFVVSVSGSGSLALPFEPEVARSIEDCRN